MAAYKRIRSLAAKEYDFTPKVLTPGIFERTIQLPPGVSWQNRASQPAGPDGNTATHRGGPNSSFKLSATPSKAKANRNPVSTRELSLPDYDANLARGPHEV